MLPVPRRIDAKVFTSQITIAPENSTTAYPVASARTAPLPPSSANNRRPSSSIMTVKNSPPRTPIVAACHASALARSTLPAPSARLIADETLPPIAPADVVCISIVNGKASAMAASGTMPSRPM